MAGRLRTSGTAAGHSRDPDTNPSGMLKISVVVPSYNKARFIEETLASVLAQEGVPMEVLVIDDASTDGSWSMIEALANREPTLRCERLPSNRGGPFARNHGARLATGDALMFLDADDVLTPGTLAALAAALGDRTDVFAACPWRQLHRDDDGWVVRRQNQPLLPDDRDYVRAWLTDNWYFPPGAVLWPRSLFERSGGWDERLGILQDADIMVRMLVRGAGFVVADAGEALYRVHGAQGSVSKIASEASVRSRMRFLGNVAVELRARGLLDRYAESLARAWYQLAILHAVPYEDAMFECLRHADRHGGRRPITGSRVHRVLWRLLGVERKERLTRWLAARRMIRRGPSRPVSA